MFLLIDISTYVAISTSLKVGFPTLHPKQMKWTQKCRGRKKGN